MMMDPPSIVITDWEMKPMSGYRFMRMLRNRSMNPLCFVPVIVVTGHATMSIIDRAFSTGVNGVLIKPVAPVVLRRRLEWTTRDARGFVLKGDHFVLDGMDEILETRVRRNDFAELLKRQKAMQDALASHAQNAQDMVDRIVNGEVDVDELDGGLPKPDKPQRRPDTWNSWVMN
jgi:CheY-like chemotaxis protein